MYHTHGPVGSDSFQLPQQNFKHSLAGFMLISYLTGIKDDHLMLDKENHLLMSHNWYLGKRGIPSKHAYNEGTSTLPFKAPKNFVEILGGEDSALYSDFQDLCKMGLKVAHENRGVATGLQDIMSAAWHITKK